ncbi:MAG: hypothetical protein CMB80_01260 [Flammeovirgaceae bacterium]|nr:hypothetical protein [Flammeovirgaceae bacterium]
MKALVTVRADSNIAGYADITMPLLEKKAGEWGADFLRLTEEFQYSDVSDGRYHYRILELHNLLDVYDRILNLDADMLITPSCPNPFEEFTDDAVVTCLEDKGSRQSPRREVMRELQEKFGPVGWQEGYVNTGFFMTSRKHRNIFQKIQGQVWNGFGFDDALLSYNIALHKHDIQDAGYRWNHMTMFSEPWAGSLDRFKSYIIHYAGGGIFDLGAINHQGDGIDRLDQIYRDYKILYPDG